MNPEAKPDSKVFCKHSSFPDLCKQSLVSTDPHASATVPLHQIRIWRQDLATLKIFNEVS